MHIISGVLLPLLCQSFFLNIEYSALVSYSNTKSTKYLKIFQATVIGSHSRNCEIIYFFFVVNRQDVIQDMSVKGYFRLIWVQLTNTFFYLSSFYPRMSISLSVKCYAVSLLYSFFVCFDNNVAFTCWHSEYDFHFNQPIRKREIKHKISQLLYASDIEFMLSGDFSFTSLLWCS